MCTCCQGTTYDILNHTTTERKLEKRAKINTHHTSEGSQTDHRKKHNDEDDPNNNDKYTMNNDNKEETKKKQVLSLEPLYPPPTLTVLISNHNKPDAKDDDHKENHDDHKRGRNDNDNKEEEKNCPLDRHPRSHPTNPVHQVSTSASEISTRKSDLYKNPILVISSEKKMVYLLLDREASLNLITNIWQTN